MRPRTSEMGSIAAVAILHLQRPRKLIPAPIRCPILGPSLPVTRCRRSAGRGDWLHGVAQADACMLTTGRAGGAEWVPDERAQLPEPELSTSKGGPLDACAGIPVRVKRLSPLQKSIRRRKPSGAKAASYRATAGANAVRHLVLCAGAGTGPTAIRSPPQSPGGGTQPVRSAQSSAPAMMMSKTGSLMS